MLRRALTPTLILAFLLLHRPAHASGNARVRLLEPELHYEFTESVRKILPAGQHQAYWARKTAAFKDVLHHASPALRRFASRARKAKIPLRALDLARDPQESAVAGADAIVEQSKSGVICVGLDGPNGLTVITVQVSRPLSRRQAEELLRLTKEIEYDTLRSAWEAADTPPAPSDAFRDGLVIGKHLARYSLGVTTTSMFRSGQRPAIEAQLRAVLDRVAPALDTGLRREVNEGRFWLDPRKAISLERKLGSEYAAELHNDDPTRSRFNPYGPIFDAFGRRSSQSVGFTVVTLLFVSTDPWDESDPRGAKRGAFEEWMAKTVRDALAKPHVPTP